MKRIFAITSVAVLAFASLASAQSSTSKPLADVAKTEEARRKEVKKPAKVFTNGNLRPDTSRPTPPPTAPVDAAAAPPDTTTPAEPPTDDARGKDQAYWASRIKTARELLARTQIFADSLQSRINALTTDFVNRDDPAQRGKIEGDRKATLAELERVKKELEAQAKAITAIEEEARRAGVPAGWLRPGV